MFEEYRKSTEDGLKIPDEFDELINEINGKNNEKRDDKTNNNYVEVNLNLFTIENDKIKILLLKKKDEPYKNHLVLPSETLKIMEDVSKKIENIIYFDLKLDGIYFKQSYFFSNIRTSTNNNSISLSYIGIINIDEFKKSVDKNILYSWFPIDDLPKIEFDYSKIIKEVQKQLKDILIKSTLIKQIFPKTFRISELQDIYEQLLNEKFDRRNFRKKIVKLNIIEETGEIDELTNGRPAKLYKFKENIEELNLF